MNRQILNNALIAMGYRKMDKGTHYGKPIGFGIVICEIDETNNHMTFKSVFKNHKGETMIWDHAEMPLTVIDYETEQEIQLNSEELFDEYVKKIAYGEYECHTERIVENFNHKNTFAFITPTDYISIF